MTPDELKQWREAMGWTREQAASALGLGLRAYAYLEGGSTSAGTPRQEIPRYIELAAAELRRTKRRPS
jgi:transcriptional regulator with XRE-family HTH domain